MENKEGGGYFLRKQLAACRATEQEDYRDAKVNVAQTTVYRGWQNRGGIVLKSIMAVVQ